MYGGADVTRVGAAEVLPHYKAPKGTCVSVIALHPTVLSGAFLEALRKRSVHTQTREWVKLPLLGVCGWARWCVFHPVQERMEREQGLSALPALVSHLGSQVPTQAPPGPRTPRPLGRTERGSAAGPELFLNPRSVGHLGARGCCRHCFPSLSTPTSHLQVEGRTGGQGALGLENPHA